MRKLLIVLLALVGTLASGCTLTETAGERHRRIWNIYQLQARMAVEDFDYILLQDKVAMTTPWHVREGLPD